MAMTANPRRRTAELTSVELDGEVVIYDERTREVHSLNASASLIWQLCDGTAAIDELAEDIADVFELPAEQAAAQVAELVDRLGAMGLMDESGGPSS